MTAVLVAGTTASAEQVRVTVTGAVRFISAPNGLFGSVDVGDPSSFTFTVDSETFVDGEIFPNRGYVIDHGSFTFSVGDVEMGLQDPFPGTPYFIIMHVAGGDSFRVGTVPDYPRLDLPLDERGPLTQLNLDYSAGFPGGTLESVDIVDAAGTYDGAGVTYFDWGVEELLFDHVGMSFDEMTIEVVAPACPGDVDGDGEVGFDDLVAVLTAWGVCGECPEDLDDDGTVSFNDLLIVLDSWGTC